MAEHSKTTDKPNKLYMALLDIMLEAVNAHKPGTSITEFADSIFKKSVSALSGYHEMAGECFVVFPTLNGMFDAKTGAFTKFNQESGPTPIRREALHGLLRQALESMADRERQATYGLLILDELEGKTKSL
jgi:hypothetical protein